MRGLLLAACLVAVQACAVAASHAAAIPVGDGTLEFDPGAGLCFLDPAAHDFDRTMQRREERASEGGRAVLALYMSCDGLQQARDGAADGFGVLGVLTAPLEDGDIEQVRSRDLARALTKLTEMLGGLPDDLDQRIASGVADARRMFSGEVTGLVSAPVGLLARDAFGVYVGTVVRMDVGQPRLMATVTTLTIATDRMVVHALSRDLVDAGTFTELLDGSKHVARALVEANPGSAGWGWRDFGMMLLALAILLGAGFVVFAPIAIRFLNRAARKRAGG